MKYSLSGIDQGSHLSAGVHEVKITDVQYATRNTKKGQQRVMIVTFKDAMGLGHKETFWFTDKAAWRIKALASACGLATTPEEVEKFDTEYLLGCYCRVRLAEVVRQGDDRIYHEAISFSKSEKPVKNVQEPAPPADGGRDFFDDDGPPPPPEEAYQERDMPPPDEEDPF